MHYETCSHGDDWLAIIPCFLNGDEWLAIIQCFLNLVTNLVEININMNKKGQHRSCHNAKCDMLNKWLKTKTKFYTGHSYFHHHTPQTWPFHAHMHKHKPHTYNNIWHMQPTTKKWQNYVLPPDKCRVFLVARFVLAEIYDCCHLANIM